MKKKAEKDKISRKKMLISIKLIKLHTYKKLLKKRGKGVIF